MGSSGPSGYVEMIGPSQRGVCKPKKPIGRSSALEKFPTPRRRRPGVGYEDYLASYRRERGGKKCSGCE